MRVRGEANYPYVTDPDQFFMDWAAAWDEGIGELLGTTDEDSELEKDEEEDE